MKISSARLPFYSALAAAFVPWVDGLTNSNVPAYFFDLALICFAGIALALDRKLHLRISLPSWVFTLCFCLCLVVLFILHRMHFLISFLVVVPVTLAYVIFLTHSSVNPGELLRQLKWVYLFHVGFIIIELLLFYFDLRYVLSALSGDRYRDIYFALLVRIDPRFGNFAPNSMLLQGQAAGHLVMAAFLLFYLASGGKPGRSNFLVLTLLFLLFFVVTSNTSLVILIILFAAIWMIRANLYVKVLTMLLLPLIAYLFLDAFLPTIFYQFYEGGALAQSFDLYWWLLTIPFVNLLDAQPMQFFFGHGSDREALESGELGFATVAYIGGVYVVGLLFIWLSSILIAGFMRYQRFRNARELNVAAWSSLLFVNIILCAAWALSSAHYLIVLIPGGMHLFAFSLAIVITANSRLRRSSHGRVPEGVAPKHFEPAKADLLPG